MSAALDAAVRSQLSRCTGVIHLGANLGQERELYAQYDLNVVWVEAIPEVCGRLRANLVGFPKQKAYNALISSQDAVRFVLNIASNDGQSSSIFDLGRHKDLAPYVSYVGRIELESTTLDTFMERERLSPLNYQKLHVDVQGADLLALQGATETLKSIKFVETEVSSVELYKGSCFEEQVTGFLQDHGFRLTLRDTFLPVAGGSWTENLYERF